MVEDEHLDRAEEEQEDEEEEEEEDTDLGIDALLREEGIDALLRDDGRALPPAPMPHQSGCTPAWLALSSVVWHPMVRTFVSFSINQNMRRGRAACNSVPTSLAGLKSLCP